MTIQHRLISDSELHEPKGVVSAIQGAAYVADGVGSGTWKKVSSTELQGLSGDSGVAGKVLVSDGANGFIMTPHITYGVMGVTNNTAAFTVAASADPLLATTADYALFTGAGAPLAGELLYGVTFSTNRLIAPVAGVYEARMWGNVSGFPSNTAAVGVRFKVSNTTFSPRAAIVKSTAAGDNGNLSAFGLVTLAANDYLQIYVASTASGNLVINNLNLTLEFKRAT